MQTYHYGALTKEGLPTKGIVKALDENEAVNKIKKDYPIVTNITEVKEETGLLAVEVGGNKINEKDLSVMCSQFAIILESGVSIARAMEMIAAQTEDKKLKKMLIKSAEDISEGTGIAEAMERNGPGLPITFIETIRAGEKSGTIENSFKAMEIYFAKSHKTTQQVKKALTYPIFVIGVAIVVLVIIMIKVIPALSATFADLGAELPKLTQITIGMSDFFAHKWYIILGVIGLLVGIKKGSQSTDEGKAFWSRNALKAPVLGHIRQLAGASEFANTMAVLISAGISVDEAVATAAKTMSNYTLGKELEEVTPYLQEGKTFGECIRRCEHLPDTLKEMCSIGEETGELERTLETIGEYYDNEAQHATEQAVQKLEPTILVFLSVFAGFIVISIYLPIFTMYNYM